MEGLLEDMEGVHAVICYRAMAGVPAYTCSTDDNNSIAPGGGGVAATGLWEGTGDSSYVCKNAHAVAGP